MNSGNPEEVKEQAVRMPVRKKSKKSSAMVVAKKALRLARRAQDNRVITLAYASYANTSATAQTVTYVQQGDALGERQSNEIHPKRIVARVRIDATALGVATPQFVRCLIVQDKQQVADTVPSVQDVWGTATPEIYTQLSPDSVPSRFSVLHDSVHSVQLQAAGAVAPDSTTFEVTCSPLKRKVTYNGAANTDQESNGIYLFMIGEATKDPYNAYCYVNTRLYYIG